MYKKIKVILLAFTVFCTFTLSVNAESNTVDTNKTIKVEYIEADGFEVEPQVAPIIIGIAIRALFSLGRAELARYLQEQGVNAYCSRYGDSGPKYVSDLICK